MVFAWLTLLSVFPFLLTPSGQDKVCLPSDILQLNLCSIKGTLESLLSFGEGSQAPALSSHLLGFGVFYCTLMLLLFMLYRWFLTPWTQAWRGRGISLLTFDGVGVFLNMQLWILLQTSVWSTTSMVTYYCVVIQNCNPGLMNMIIYGCNY